MNLAVKLIDIVEELVSKDGTYKESIVLNVNSFPFKSENLGGDDTTLKSGSRSVMLKNNLFSRVI